MPKSSRDDLLDLWLREKSPLWKPSTRITNRAAVATLRGLLASNAEVRSNRSDLTGLDALTAQRLIVAACEGRSRESVVSLRRQWKAAWNWAISFGLATTNPWVPTQVPERNLVDLRDCRARLDQAPVEDPVPALIRWAWQHDPQVALFVELAACTGCRSGELRALTWLDFSTDCSRVLIAKALSDNEVSTTKTGDEVILHLPAALATKLRFLRNPSTSTDAWLFTADGVTPWGRSVIRRRMLRACQTAGITPVTPRDLRRWVATTLATRASVEHARQRLRHTTSGTTTRHYVGRDDDVDVASAELLGAAAAG